MTAWKWFSRIVHAWNVPPHRPTSFPNPRPTARAWRPVNSTYGYWSDSRAKRRTSRSKGRYATERRVDTGFAGPNGVRCSARTKSDPDPRSSFGNQNPYVVQTTWNPRGERSRSICELYRARGGI